MSNISIPRDNNRVTVVAGTSNADGTTPVLVYVDPTTHRMLVDAVPLPRSNTVASSATPSINTNTTDIFTITALATAITSMSTNLTGTPLNGQKLIIRILDNGSSQNITWGSSFASRGATLPTATTMSKYTYVGLIYNSTTSTWDCVATATES